MSGGLYRQGEDPRSQPGCPFATAGGLRAKRYVLAAVCDGLGGLEKGELASSEVLRSLADWFQSRFPEVLMAGFPERELLGDWKNLVHTENERLRTYGEKQGIVLGTTLTAALFTEENWYASTWASAGCMKLRQDTARQLTRDHSLAAEAWNGVYDPGGRGKGSET